MRLPRRTLTFLLPAITIAVFEAVFRWPPAVLFLLPALLIFLFAAIFVVLGRGLKTPSSRWNFWLGPALFYICAFAILFLLESARVRYALVFAGALLMGLFFESIYTYIWEHEWYEAYSLENISSYLNSLSVFLAGSAFLGLKTFLQAPFWLPLPLVALIYGLLAWQTFWIAKVPWNAGRLFSFVVTLIMVEFFLVFSFLPIHYLVAGAALGVLWYTLTSLSRAHLLGVLSSRIIFRYVALSGALLALLFSTARWL